MNFSYVVDCSAVMGLCFNDEFAEDYHNRLLEIMSSSTIVVPSIWTAEIGNVLLVGERRGRITASNAAKFVGHLSSLSVRTVDLTELNSVPGIMGIAREFDLSYYDAQYLHLAIRDGHRLATRDKKLRSAAKKARLDVL